MLGSIFTDIAGLELTDDEKQHLQHPAIGGVVLFSRNYHSKQQLITLCQAIHNLRCPALLIAVDHEGGRVQRFLNEFTRLPSMQSLAENYNNDGSLAVTQAEQWGFTMASELKACGVDISFAPVLDLDKGISRVLQGGRATSSKVDTAVAIAGAYIQGMHQAGMAATGKHFPGHGSVSLDSHLNLPIDTRCFAEIMADDLQVFIQLMPALDAMMPAHIVFEQVDDKPVSLSKTWLNGILRQQLNYQGVIISDCLSMMGAVKIVPDPTERVQLALSAGCDIVLMCNNPDAVNTLLADYSLPRREDLTDKLEKLRQRKHA